MSRLSSWVDNALAYLKDLHSKARWMTPSEVLGALVADRRMLEVAATGPRARDGWRRLRFVVDQARAWSEVLHGGLRADLGWAAHQGQKASRVAEAVLPETDTDAVRVLTVHAAKGLEFPIVVLSGMTAQSRRDSGASVNWPAAGGYAVRLKSDVQTSDFARAQPVDEQMDAAERKRLLYVASTGARDHLVVSLHRSDSGRQTAAVDVVQAGGGVGGRSRRSQLSRCHRSPPSTRDSRGGTAVRQLAGRHRGGAQQQPGPGVHQRVRFGRDRARYVDLIFRDDDGDLVAVDYKTDAVPSGAIDTRVTYYQPQIGGYCTALAAATGVAVSGRLLFLNPEGSLDVLVPVPSGAVRS